MERKYEYLTNCTLGLGRDADYKTAEKLRAKFVPLQGDSSDHMIGMNGNVAGHFHINVKTYKVSVTKGWSPANRETHASLYEALPSALALYALCALDAYRVEAFGHEGYKCVWIIGMVHAETGEKIFFGEHKGAFSFWTRSYSAEKAPKTLIRDLKLLVEYLVSGRAAHPYDGLIAGSVA